MTHTSAKSVHWSSSHVHVVVALRHHVGVGGSGTRAHVSCFFFSLPCQWQGGQTQFLCHLADTQLLLSAFVTYGEVTPSNFFFWRLNGRYMVRPGILPLTAVSSNFCLLPCNPHGALSLSAWDATVNMARVYSPLWDRSGGSEDLGHRHPRSQLLHLERLGSNSSLPVTSLMWMHRGVH